MTFKISGILPLLALVFTAACAKNEISYYVLREAAPPAARTPVNFQVRTGRISVAPAYDHDRLVWRTARLSDDTGAATEIGFKINRYYYRRWANPLHLQFEELVRFQVNSRLIYEPDDTAADAVPPIVYLSLTLRNAEELRVDGARFAHVVVAGEFQIRNAHTGLLDTFRMEKSTFFEKLGDADPETVIRTINDLINRGISEQVEILKTFEDAPGYRAVRAGPGRAETLIDELGKTHQTIRDGIDELRKRTEGPAGLSGQKNR